MDWDKEYWSPGKLLLSSEYVVVNGAEAIAIPCKYGQSLKTKENNSGIIKWNGKTNHGDIWLSVELNASSLQIINTNDQKKAEKLAFFLQSAKQLTNSFPENGITIETTLDFPSNWGLGSSSTLLCNISKWLQIDAFQLHFAVSNGSGYDIACGLVDYPILYQVSNQKTTIKQVKFSPSFKQNIYFIHLNKKQHSDQEVTRYSELTQELDLAEVTKTFNSLSQQLLTVSSQAAFEETLLEHENLMAHILQRETIKESNFQLYKGGVIKSLGAWGGDFVMVTVRDENDLEYFKAKGYETILSFDQMI